MKVANGALAASQFFSILALMIFLLKFLVKKCFKIVVFPLGHRDPSGFGAAI